MELTYINKTRVRKSIIYGSNIWGIWNILAKNIWGIWNLYVSLRSKSASYEKKNF